MKTFEEILKKRISLQSAYIGDVALANMQRMFPGLWEDIKKAAHDYMLTFFTPPAPTYVGECKTKITPGPLTDEEREFIVEYLDSKETPPQPSPEGREEEAPQSNCRIITKIGE